MMAAPNHKEEHMSDFLNRMKSLAKADKKTIVLPEGEDQRTIDAARIIVEEDLANLVIIGDPATIDVAGVTVIDPATSDKRQAYADALYELRKAKGMTPEQAYEQVADATYYGTMMVKLGDADGLVSGACHSTANTLRPALQILKTAPGTKLVSSFFIMCTPATEYGEGGTLETILNGKTGLFFERQSVDSLVDCMRRFEQDGVAFSRQEVAAHGRTFSRERFREQFGSFVNQKLEESGNLRKAWQ